MHPAPEMSLKHRAFVILAIAATAAPICAMTVFPWIPVYVGVLLAAMIGGPLILWSFSYENREQAALKLESSSLQASATGNRPFWPTAAEWYTGMAWLICLSMMALPFLVIVLGLLLMPAGDSWPIVIVRILFLGLSIKLTFTWWSQLRKHFTQRCQRIFPEHALKAIDNYLNAPTSARTRKECIKDSLVWLTVGVLAFLLVTDIININNFQMKNAPKRLRGTAALIDWCCGNPNFTKASLAITTCVGLVMSASQAREAMKDFGVR